MFARYVWPHAVSPVTFPQCASGRRRDERRVLDIREHDQLLARLQVHPDTNRELGELLEELLLIHRPPP
jgi:hypothetical protein